MVKRAALGFLLLSCFTYVQGGRESFIDAIKRADIATVTADVQEDPALRNEPEIISIVGLVFQNEHPPSRQVYGEILSLFLQSGPGWDVLSHTYQWPVSQAGAGITGAVSQVADQRKNDAFKNALTQQWTELHTELLNAIDSQDQHRVEQLIQRTPSLIDPPRHLNLELELSALMKAAECYSHHEYLTTLIFARLVRAGAHDEDAVREYLTAWKPGALKCFEHEIATRDSNAADTFHRYKEQGSNVVSYIINVIKPYKKECVAGLCGLFALGYWVSSGKAEQIRRTPTPATRRVFHQSYYD